MNSLSVKIQSGISTLFFFLFPDCNPNSINLSTTSFRSIHKNSSLLVGCTFIRTRVLNTFSRRGLT